MLLGCICSLLLITIDLVVQIERMKFFVGWSVSAGRRWVSVTEKFSKRWVKALLSSDGGRWLGGVLNDLE